MLSIALLFLAIAQITLAKCPDACPLNYDPVCGSDEKTYSNECFLVAERECKGKDNLTIAYKGKCQESPLKYETAESFECQPHMKSGICTREYFPICGSNGKTYSNKCTFCYNKYKLEEQQIPLAVKHFGECQPDDYCPPYSKQGICTLEYFPVCATDKKTYPNLCSMCAVMYEQHQAGNNIILKVEYEGKCKLPRTASKEFCDSKYKTGKCTKEYFPMCGSDGKTYGNKCTFCYAKFQKEENGEELILKHEGHCKKILNIDSIECTENEKKGICTREYSPVCGTDGKTYGNKCMICYYMHKIMNKSLNIKHFGECLPEDYCPLHSKKGICTLDYNPVCATDGKTYPNLCSMCAAMYQQDIILKVVNHGECKEKRIALTKFSCDSRYKSGICTKEYLPLCGSDGKTYDNKCMFCNAKFQLEENGEELTLAHIGQCEALQSSQIFSTECTLKEKLGFCHMEYFPICGSNGQTYFNRCNFCFAQLSYQENGKALEVEHMGECFRELKCLKISQSGACPFSFYPVCSNEGKTYANECLLCADLYKRQASGENIHLHIAHDGKC